jgi:hypothetical protein
MASYKQMNYFNKLKITLFQPYRGRPNPPQ